MSDAPLPERPAPRVAEALLTDAVLAAGIGPDIRRVFCTSLGRAQLAAAVARHAPQALVECNFLDLYQASRSRPFWSDVPNLVLHCLADPPPGPYDLVALPLQSAGDAELTRDHLQTAHVNLRIGGQLWASTENPTDRWLHAELLKLFDKVSIHAAATGVVYSAEKKSPLKKIKRFACEFAFRDGPQIIRVLSRPGVFSHRQLDIGARALLEAMQVLDGDRVVDLGCGAGPVALAAALRASQVQVLAVDSNPRAVACTQQSAALNGVENLRVMLDADGRCDQPGSYDLLVGNPPYFSRNRISEIFLRGAELALKPGGTVLIVTKDIQWYSEVMPLRFAEVSVEERRGYAVLRGKLAHPNRNAI